MLLSPNFTLVEMTSTAVRGVDNSPSIEEAENLGFLCNNVLEPVRAKFGPLYTTSGYRSPAVNARIGGSVTSMHPKGCAWDGVPLKPSVKWSAVIEWLIERSDIPLDQVIYEFGRWLHIGTRPKGADCRRQSLMIFAPGKYELWNPKDTRIIK
jgi:hypothetical protein